MPACAIGIDGIPSAPSDNPLFRSLDSFYIHIIGAFPRRNGEILIITHNLSVFKFDPDTEDDPYIEWIKNEQTQDEIDNGYDASKNCVAYDPKSDIIYVTRDCELVKINLFANSTQSVPLSFYFTKLVNNNPICTVANNSLHIFSSVNTNRHLSYSETDKKFKNKCVLYEDMFTKTELNSKYRQIVYIKSQNKCVFLHNPQSPLKEVTNSTLIWDTSADKIMVTDDDKYMLPKQWQHGHEFSCLVTPDNKYILVFGYCAHGSKYHDDNNYFGIPNNG